MPGTCELESEVPGTVQDPAQQEVIEQCIARHRQTPGGLLPLLHDIQGQLGCIPGATVAAIATGMGLSRAEVHGVISFYHDFRSDPGGRHRLQICRAEACQAMGSRELTAHAEQKLGTALGDNFEQANNPALGLRAVRLSLRDAEQFKVQLRAIRRASALGAVFATSNQFVIIHGSAEATIAPIPMKKLCIAKPSVRWCFGRLSPTKARKGSIEMLMEASMIHSMPAATHSVGEFGITSSASEARMAPPRK